MSVHELQSVPVLGPHFPAPPPHHSAPPPVHLYSTHSPPPLFPTAPSNHSPRYQRHPHSTHPRRKKSSPRPPDRAPPGPGHLLPGAGLQPSQGNVTGAPALSSVELAKIVGDRWKAWSDKQVPQAQPAELGPLLIDLTPDPQPINQSTPRGPDILSPRLIAQPNIPTCNRFNPLLDLSLN